MMTVATRVLDNDRIRELAPSVFASTPWHGMSDRYCFVPTIDVVDILRERGFLPIRAQQSGTRIEGKGEFTRHMIRLRHRDFLKPDAVGDEFPELVLTNSHDGTATYRFDAGIYRLACSNGLVVASSNQQSVSVRHLGGTDFRDKIIDATFRIVEDTPNTLTTINEWKALELTPPQQAALATAAVVLMDNETINPKQVLRSHRYDDNKSDLWTTFNRVQENVLGGGIRTYNAKGRRNTTRKIKAIDKDIKLNKALWTLAAELAKTVGV